MKQPKRNFVIEYKSGRRRSSTTQSSSIWGNLDLKSVAQAVETDMPKPATGIDRHAIDTPSKHLAQDIVAETNAPASVTAPPDSEDVVAGVGTGTPVDSDALADGEEAISANDAIGLAKGDATGETPRLEPTGAEGKRHRMRKTGVSRDRKPVKPMSSKPKLASLSEADKELAELFQLEEENRQLRSLLVLKLHEENGWLRERLQRG